MIGPEAKECMALALTYRKKLYDNGWNRTTNDYYGDALVASMESCLCIFKNDLGRNQEREREYQDKAARMQVQHALS